MLPLQHNYTYTYSSVALRDRQTETPRESDNLYDILYYGANEGSSISAGNIGGVLGRCGVFDLDRDRDKVTLYVDQYVNPTAAVGWVNETCAIDPVRGTNMLAQLNKFL